MNRSAPSDGYDFGNKRQYRRDVWSEAADFCRHQRSTAQVLLMPSIEGDEIEEAERRGFKRYNMHVVDNNAAIVVHLKRRFPGINVYGVDVLSALKRIVKAGVKLSFANFDFCSHVEHLRHTIDKIGIMDDAFTQQSLVCVSVMRGREQHSFVKVANIMGDPDEGMNKMMRYSLWPQMRLKVDLMSEVDRFRLMLVHSGLTQHIDGHGCKITFLDKSPKIYKSNKVTMMWMGFKRCRSIYGTPWNGGCFCRVCSEFWNVACSDFSEEEKQAVSNA